MSVREFSEGLQVMGEDEAITFTLTTTNWGSSPTSPSMVVKTSEGADVTATVTSGSASVSGDVITLPKISGLTAGTLYRVEVKFTTGGFAPGEAYGYIQCEE